jgi:transcriptional regulator with XRE-family HTH domain
MDAASLLRRTRREAGLTQAELAGRLGKAQSTVAALERPGANPSVATLHEALNALGFRLELAAARDRSGVDESLIERNLRRSPAERLAAFETAHAEVDSLRRAMRRARAS